MTERDDHNGEYGRGAEPLTARERARLRPGVDAAALERLLRHLLAGAPPEEPRRVPGAATRRGVLAQFFSRVTLDDARAALDEVGAPEARRAEVERWYPVSEGAMRAHWRERRAAAILFAWHGQLTDPAELLAAGLLSVDLPRDASPELRALWDAVEPHGEAAFRRSLAATPLGPGVAGRVHAGGPRRRRWCDACGAREATMAWVRGDGAEPAVLIPTTDAAVVYDEDEIPPAVRRAMSDLQAAAVARGAGKERVGRPDDRHGDPGGPPAAAPEGPLVEYLCENCARRRGGSGAA